MATGVRSTPMPPLAAASVAEPPRRISRTTIGIFIVLVAQLMLTLDTTVVNVALPKMDAGLGFGPASLSWVLNAYTLAFGGLLLLGGRLGDVYGRLRIFEIGVVIFTASSLLGGFAQFPAWLIASRVSQGIGAALAAPGVLALVTTSARNEAARNRSLALFAAFSMGGGTVGLVLGGVITQFLSWRWTLFINVPLGILVLMLARRFVDETTRRPERFDLVGALSSFGAATAIVWALIGAPTHGWTSPLTIGGLVVGAALLVVLIATEYRIEHPMLRLALLRSRLRISGLMVSILIMGSQIAILFLVVQYVQKVLGFGPIAAGAVVLPMTLGIFTMTRFVPQLMSRFGARTILMIATAGLAVSYAWFSTLGTDSNVVTAVLAPMLLDGLAAGMTFMPATSLVVAGVDRTEAGSASGLLQTAQQLGGSIGLAVLVSVYAAGAAPGQFVPGVRGAFLTATGFALLAFVVVALLGRDSE